MTTWLFLVSLSLSATGDTKVAVMPTRFLPSANKQVEHAAVDEAVLTAAHGVAGFEVIGMSDMNAVLGFDKQKQALGCEDTACFAEIGGALGVQRIIDVQVAKADDVWVVSAKLIDISAGAPRVLKRISTNSGQGGATVLFDFMTQVVRALLGAGEAPKPGAGSVVTASFASVKAPTPLPVTADADVLVAYDAALKTEANASDAPSEAATAWAKIAEMKAADAKLRKESKERAASWSNYAKQKADDETKVRKLLPLDSFPFQQKVALLENFGGNYGMNLAVKYALELAPAADREKLCNAVSTDATTRSVRFVALDNFAYVDNHFVEHPVTVTADQLVVHLKRSTSGDYNGTSVYSDGSLRMSKCPGRVVFQVEGVSGALSPSIVVPAMTDEVVAYAWKGNASYQSHKRALCAPFADKAARDEVPSCMKKFIRYKTQAECETYCAQKSEQRREILMQLCTASQSSSSK